MRFEYFRILGEGALGQVWKAYDRLLDRMIALKVYHSSSTQDWRERDREAGQLRRLQHPNIVQIA